MKIPEIILIKCSARCTSSADALHTGVPQEHSYPHSEFNLSDKLNRGIEKGFHRLCQDLFNPVDWRRVNFKACVCSMYLDNMRDSEVFGDGHL